MKRKVLALIMSCTMLMQNGTAVSAENVVFEEPPVESAVFEELPVEQCEEEAIYDDAAYESAEAGFSDELLQVETNEESSGMLSQTEMDAVSPKNLIPDEAESGLAEVSDEILPEAEEELLAIEDMEIVELQSEIAESVALDATAAIGTSFENAQELAVGVEKQTIEFTGFGSPQHRFFKVTPEVTGDYSFTMPRHFTQGTLYGPDPTREKLSSYHYYDSVGDAVLCGTLTAGSAYYLELSYLEGEEEDMFTLVVEYSTISLKYEQTVTVRAGQRMTLSVQGSELNGKELTYQWMDEAETVLSDQQVCEITAPSENAEYKCIVSADGFSQTATIYVTVQYTLELGKMAVTAPVGWSSRTYLFTPQADGYYAFYSEGDADMEASLYDGKGNELTEGDEWYGGRIYKELHLSAGETYKLEVSVDNEWDVSTGRETITALYVGTNEMSTGENNVFLGKYDRCYYFTPQQTGYYSIVPSLKNAEAEDSFYVTAGRADKDDYDYMYENERILFKAGVRYKMKIDYDGERSLSVFEPGSVRIDYSTWAADPYQPVIKCVPGYPSILDVKVKYTETMPALTCEWTDPQGALVATTQGTKLELEDTAKQGYWKCKISDGSSSQTVEIQVSNTGSLTVWGSDTIYAEPGSSVTLQVFAETSAGSISYQWYVEQEEDSVKIDGAVSDTYTIDNLTSPGVYYCRVKNEYEYRYVDFSVTPDTGLTLKNEWTDLTVLSGNPVTMTVEATVNPGYSLSYQWYVWEKNESSWDTTKKYLENGTSSSYTVSAVEKPEQYCCDISDGFNTVTAMFEIDVTNGLTVEKDYFNINVPYGEKQITLCVTATSPTPITYTWCSDPENLPDPNDPDVFPSDLDEFLAGFTGPEVVLDSQWFDERIYCIVQNDFHTIEKGNAVEVCFDPRVHLVDSGDSLDGGTKTIVVPDGGNTVLEVKTFPAAVSAGCSYEWICNGEIVDGANKASLTVENVTDYVTYTCTVSSAEKDGDSSWPRYSDTCYFAVYPEGIMTESLDTAKPLASGQKLKAYITNMDSTMYFRICPDTTDSYTFFTDEWEMPSLKLYDSAGKILKEGNGDSMGIKLHAKLTEGLTYYLGVSGDPQVCNVSMMTARQAACTHVWELVKTDPSACLPGGATVKKCVRCSLVQGDALSQSTHTFNEEWTIDKKPTCNEAGEKSHHCTNCGERKDITPLPATGQHTWGEGTVLQPSTCKVNGRKSYTCTVCGQTRTEELPLEAHSYSDSWVVDKEPTCTGKGEKSHHCTNCGERKDITEMAAAGSHKWGDGTVTAPAACTADGTVTYKCAVCGETRTEKTSGTGHVFGVWTTSVQATVFEPEKQMRACSVCGFTEEQTIGTKLEATGDLNVTSIKLKRKQSTKKVEVLGLAESDYVKSWESDNTKIVKVSESGKITAGKKTGKATITVTLASGRELKLQVKVQKPTVHTSKISGISKKITLQKGKKLTLKPVISPITSVDKVTYKSTNKRVATVSSKGVIKAKKKGRTVITVKSGKKSVKCKVTVK